MALDQREVVIEFVLDSRPTESRSAQPRRARPARNGYAVPPQKAVEQARRARRRRPAGHARAKRVALLLAGSAAIGLTLLVSAFGSGSTSAVRTAPAPAQRLLPSGPPRPQVVALRDALKIQMPLSQTRITAVGYHGADNGALPLEPVGRQGNERVLARLVRRIAGTGDSGITWYQLGGDGPKTAVLDVGASPGTDVYSPVDGTVVGITPYVVSGERLGSGIDIQPANAPSLVVSLTHLRSDPTLTVGAAVSAATSKIGTVLDFSRVERQSLARYTQDAGNHVSLEVHPAATLAIP